MTLIELQDVSKSFWIPDERRDTIREHVFGAFRPRPLRELRVLQSVSLSLRRGEALGLMGGNGAGKSTLLKILCGIYVADSGRVVANAAITPILELGVGWNPELDAVDNICLMGTVMGMSLRELRRDVDEILEFAELRPFARMHLKHYSSGMSARLAYAVAFKAVREVLVLDEVLAVGDAGFKQRCQERYRELRRRGHSAIVVSHNPDLISTFCDRALLLEGGRFVMEGSAEGVAAAYFARLTHGGDPAPC
jgi:ABC-type polysaccharide/polyol phosphate transport system ATPase subunit